MEQLQKVDVIAQYLDQQLPAEAFSAPVPAPNVPAIASEVVPDSPAPSAGAIERIINEPTAAALAYWEGAVTVTGDRTGVGYVELTGYAGRR